MALRNNPNASTANPAFESEDETTTMTTNTAIATSTPSTVALRSPNASAVISQNVLSAHKDAFRVDYDTCPRCVAEQGTFVVKFDGVEEEIGTGFTLGLMSYQDSWVVSPNDKKADVELVKYSDDGITSKDGIDLKKHLADLLEQGYSRSKIVQRCVVVGELLTVSNPEGSTFIEKLVQIDLPESGRKSFNAYTLQASFAVAKGRKSVEDAGVLNVKAVKDKTKAGEVYTKITFA